MKDIPDAVAALVDTHGLLGLALVRRDGIPAVSSFRRSADDGSFAAMVAAGWGAWEAAFSEWSPDTPAHGLFSGPGVAVAVAGLDDEILLAVVADAPAKAQQAIGPCREAVAGMLGG